MFAELDKVALTTALPLDYEFMVDVPMKDLLLDSENGGGLIPGDVGIVVDVQGGGEWLCVEFLEWSGCTVALADMPASCARPATERDIAEARFLGKMAARTVGRDNLIE